MRHISIEGSNPLVVAVVAALQNWARSGAPHRSSAGTEQAKRYFRADNPALCFQLIGLSRDDVAGGTGERPSFQFAF